MKSIEKEMGREFDTSAVGGYSDRIIDIDIVKFNNINFESSKLRIPHHKHLYEREFSRFLLENLNI
ncbi:MAG: 2-amino-4-hydroxy-6-hydroxymethyldihydropteridine diphosphokinase [Cloacibacterium normanense]